MAAHTTDEFNTFMGQLRETNQTLDFFCDFEKINENVENIKLSLCMLNSLIGSTNLRSSVETIWRRDKSAFNVMDILIAVRSEGSKKVLNQLGECIVLDDLFQSVDGVMEFLETTGLADVFQTQKITNLVDYVFGVETGLDSNARKNRSGHVMEHTIAEVFRSNGVKYETEVYAAQWSKLTQALGEDTKRFDFVVRTSKKVYLFEVNFYSGGGSKLNEVARSYSDIAPKINAVEGFEFVWITDGVGWNSARNKLQEAFNIIPNIQNLTTIDAFAKRLKQEQC